MAGFFKKALGVFVEFDDENKEIPSSFSPLPNLTIEITKNPENRAEAGKFEKYFDALFENSNFPGPDYFEFHKTMEMLETHIPDETARFSATFASLSIQGLTKDLLVDTAAKYKAIILQDHVNFNNVLKEKLKLEVEERQSKIIGIDEKIKQNSELIQKLTREISEAQVSKEKLKTEVGEQESKLRSNQNGYQIACQAMLNKIESDIQKIKNIL